MNKGERDMIHDKFVSFVMRAVDIMIWSPTVDPMSKLRLDCDDTEAMLYSKAGCLLLNYREAPNLTGIFNYQQHGVSGISTTHGNL